MKKCRIPGQSSNRSARRARSAVLVAAGLLTCAAPVAAQDATWLAAPGSNYFNTSANWSTGSVPIGTASFGASNTTALTLIMVTSLDALQFNAGAPAYTFGGTSFAFSLTGAGIVNTSSNAPTFAVSGTDYFNHATLNFYNSSTAANAIITNTNYGTTVFHDTSSAGSATITNTGGFVNFRDASSAGNATINNSLVVNFYDLSAAGSATIVNSGGAATIFQQGSTAGNATITNNAGSSTLFVNTSTAADATIINNTDGKTTFAWTSTGGAARLVANAGGVVDFSLSTGPNNDNKLSAGSLEGAGNFYLGANQLTVGGNNLSTMVAGSISDCGAGTDCQNSGAAGGSLVKVGTGTLVLAGTETYTGSTTVSEGTLFVSGTLATSATTVASGGTLGGTGTVGDVTVNAGGILAPGDGTAGSSITVSGNLALQSAAIYLVQVNPATASFAAVTGKATLGGATVNANFAVGNYVAKRYTILTASGGIDGTFGSLVTSSLPTNNLHAALSYGANDVYLDLLLNFAIPSDLNGNQQAVGNALTTFFNTTGGIPTVFSALTPAGLTQASGELATGAQQATFNAMTQFMGAMTDPFAVGRDDGVSAQAGASQFAETDDASAYAPTGRKRSASDAYAAISRKAPVTAGPFTQGWSVWAAGYGGTQTTDGNAVTGSNTVTSRLFGTAVGADYRFSPNTVAGFALAGGGTNFSVANGGTGRSDLFQAGAFVRHTVGAAYLSGALAYGWQDVTTTRTVTIAGTDQLQARFNANAYSGRVEGGYRVATPWMGLTPYAAGQFTTFDLPAYAEQALSGTNTFALSYGGKSVTDTRSELGLRADRSLALTDAILTLRGRAAWAHDFNPERAIATTFQALPGASFVVNGAAQARDAALTTASAEVKWLNGFSLAATFEGEFSNVTRSYAGKGAVRYAW